MEFANQLVQEGSASPAEVFVTENSFCPNGLSRKGRRICPVKADTLAQVSEAFRQTRCNWVGIAARSTVFAYDNAKLTEAFLPKSMMDLANPSWKGRWVVSSTGADFQAIVGVLVK